MGIRILYPGEAEGKLLRLAEPLSFWGGIDPASGAIIDVRHPQHGDNVAGRILVMAAAIGSSSSSSVMLELIRNGRAPAAVLMAKADAILVVGCIVAREMGLAAPPMVEDTCVLARDLGPGCYRLGRDGALGRTTG